ncbi:integration host factor subunit alpha [Dethiosulfatarculus sandiegensis]|uniref:Integration host factor subunit alpha n=1 Tax=Dethiosulfatarculus sandiegensis TaxID=1429043 RepID=A0A0D2J785_9BACT|nr:integration host factor subunit alpha [Dethiosulfatarculus sandiegensis]KIX14049.1 integration host factor subunit alpha [Dethiosulfatarculus sandiegensis]
MALTKEKIIEALFEEIDIPKSESRRLVENTLEIIKSALESGEDVLLSGFGKFVVKRKQPRRGRNPQTKQDIQLRARKVVVFKVSGVLRTNINNGHYAG